MSIAGGDHQSAEINDGFELSSLYFTTKACTLAEMKCAISKNKAYQILIKRVPIPRPANPPVRALASLFRRIFAFLAAFLLVGDA